MNGSSSNRVTRKDLQIQSMRHIEIIVIWSHCDFEFKNPNDLGQKKSYLRI
ncbi:hypothetical protein LEP1GSC067_1328 [Leptospira interrogans serovar Lora str. TE 1992]|uniref:Uncharacterized protein n=5 Tax=Leptospira interrogans TaxID=173 RepID=M6ZYD0_LEPIR|nr:hypothetical protein LEP1GSC067_1328 [Leptospira interrogans serovar Lora str. TE 1992]EMM83102.1 hypothetical protein LEP1GSC037_2467 [Leptospira interrogans str. 2006001854]EMM93433.1 hypothetical protein LEP1GSC158_4436 [Leptospira interrogans serovar Zanoni str. LT2156]EMP09322.1 hypothetical protein LEP1GSC124_3021 [Leptospira interrogans serovar Pyrogenes str. 200701872]EMY24947.1 hypothetical protein LEP1GSC115_5378 [Leptospira interrogans serovar Australis str. 200703203]